MLTSISWRGLFNEIRRDALQICQPRVKESDQENFMLENFMSDFSILCMTFNTYARLPYYINGANHKIGWRRVVSALFKTLLFCYRRPRL